MSSTPRVTIGIPASNRVADLRGTMESVLAQEEDIEVVISGSTSRDCAREACREYADRDPRVRFVELSVDSGSAANFQRVLDVATGRYFAWLDDHDWLEPGYVRECAAVLDSSPEHMLVGGLARYLKPGARVHTSEDPLITLEQDSPRERMLTYFTLVAGNGICHGLCRREEIRRIGAPRGLAWNWRLGALLAYHGKIRMLQTVHVNRLVPATDGAEGSQELDELSSFFSKAENLGMRVAWQVFWDVAWGIPDFRSATPFARQRLALDAADAVLTNRYGSKMHLLRSRVRARERARRLFAT